MRGVWLTVIAALLVALLASVFAQAWVLPSRVERLAGVFPEVEPLTVPAIVWGVAAIACWQAIGLIGLRLAVLARRHRLGASDYGWWCRHSSR